ncbi:FG-GAP repeat protein [Streptomyces melanosporofaciens]|uniref:FG-GAP repeat-containing protein n=1 Tax=Streptomyces melanosporofaciens TaxID=67327 RepID=A0A1H4RFH7_STRMJ|nr:FG-GAP repeat protein [Streptomyces melanosporofaciens]SEC30514.1 FG-GAP repeat-containing protein [Streptomyces melanosporofaciens]
MTPAPPPTAPPGRVPGPRLRSLLRVPTASIAAGTACLALLLTACGPEDGGAQGGRDGSASAGGSVITPTATAPVPHGKGSRLPDDVNGDGYPDLRLPVPSGKGGLPSRIAFVHGSSHGLNPATRTVLRHRDLGLPSQDVTVAGATEVATADLDGDGYADVTTTAGEALDERETERTQATVRTVPYISWGGPGGPQRTHSAARVQLTGPEDGVDAQRPTVGDFNGDGHHDLALIREDRRSLLVLYGPFNRAGKAARTVPYASPLDGHGEIGDLIADTIADTGTADGTGTDTGADTDTGTHATDGHRATDLVVHAVNDNDQSGSTLLTAGSHGLSPEGRRLREGNAITFGDFDGDGRRDVAVGDSGTRNDEPGVETERPDIGKTVSVYYKRAARPGRADPRPLEPRPLKMPGMSGKLAAADTNGDGTDELAVSLGRGGVELLTLRRASHTATPRVAGRHLLTRAASSVVDGKTVRKGERAARLYDVADFDHDGKDEVVLAWGPGLAFSRYGERPEWWWITDGTKDKTAFSSKPFGADAD